MINMGDVVSIHVHFKAKWADIYVIERMDGRRLVCYYVSYRKEPKTISAMIDPENIGYWEKCDYGTDEASFWQNARG